MSHATCFLSGISVIALMYAAAFPVAADEIAFWGCEASATNRVCASSRTVAISPFFESRLCSTAEVPLQKFSSNKFGTVLTVR
jgi:hypothetical protein